MNKIRMGVTERGIIKKKHESDKTANCMLIIFRARTEPTSDRLICTNKVWDLHNVPFSFARVLKFTVPR